MEPAMEASWDPMKAKKLGRESEQEKKQVTEQLIETGWVHMMAPVLAASTDLRTVNGSEQPWDRRYWLRWEKWTE